MRWFPALALVLSLVGITAGCSSTYTSPRASLSSPQAPVFTSTPETQASQGAAYTYQLAATDPSGGTITFALKTAPDGATLNGKTVSWTPSAAQSRVSNSFTVTATNSLGGTGQQSWSISPNGTITVNLITTYWSPSGPVKVAEAASGALDIRALVPESDGSITLLLASATATPGVFPIANVPAGNFWLAVEGSAFWTDSSTFDAGTDVASAPPPLGNTPNSTNIDLNVSGIAAESSEEWIEFYTDPLTDIAEWSLPPEFTTLTGGFGAGGYTNWSQVNTAFVMQYELQPLGALNNYVLGPEVTLSNLALTNGATNTISATLNDATETSLDVSVSGSQWAAAFNNVGPAAATVQDSVLTLVAEPYVTGINPSSSLYYVTALALAGPSAGNSGFVGQTYDPEASVCSDYTGEVGAGLTGLEPSILTDEDLGTLQYADPFDSNWTRALAFCEQSTIPIPLPDSGGTYSFLLEAGAAVTPSTSSLVPLALPVQNPTINGSSLFMANTISSVSPAISWSTPAGTHAPYGYTVGEYLQTSVNGTAYFQPIGAFGTSSTSVTLPPLAGGNTYLFSITTNVDAAANMKTSPFRSALPTGFSSVVSAPITISPSAAAPQIRGDMEGWRRAIKPGKKMLSGIGTRPVATSCSAAANTTAPSFCESN